MPDSSAAFALPERITLSAGEVWCQHCAAGTRILIRTGAARLIEPPLWLADTVITPHQLLHAGQMHILARGGWTQLQMLAPGEVWAEPPPPSAWRVVWQRLRGGIKKPPCPRDEAAFERA